MTDAGADRGYERYLQDHEDDQVRGRVVAEEDRRYPDRDAPVDSEAKQATPGTTYGTGPDLG